MPRFKNRYLVARLSSTKFAESCDAKEFLKVLREAFLVLHGEVKLVKLGSSLQDSNAAKICLLRCARNFHKETRSALTLLNRLTKCDCVVSVIGVSGSFEKAKTLALKEINFQLPKEPKNLESRRQIKDLISQSF
jgi:RNase P/RNase MRP subunit POP5